MAYPTPPSASPALPYQPEIAIEVHNPSAQRVNANDWVAFSGQTVIPTNSGHTAYWKASGAGIALEGSPTYDAHGRVATATALLVATQGTFWVSAAFSGQPALGLGAYPVSTGSGVAAPTGMTGVGATWQTAAPVTVSGGTAGRAAPVATVIGSRNFSNGGTGELLVRLAPLAPDYRG